jgi:integrator complex subunit 11
MVATAGMLGQGLSYEFFYKQKWYSDPRNLIIFPGYCGERTLGRAVLQRSETNRVEWDSPDGMHHDFVVRCKVDSVAFSAHADQFEILTMCERLRPREVVTIHGDPESVAGLAQKIKEDLGVPAHVATLCTPVQLRTKDMRIVEIDRACCEKVGGVFTKFEGAVVDVGDGRMKVCRPEKSSMEMGVVMSRVSFRRRFRTRLGFDEICEVLMETGLIEEKPEGSSVIQTKDFSVMFADDGLVLEYDISGRSAVNAFCCLIQSE